MLKAAVPSPTTTSSRTVPAARRAARATHREDWCAADRARVRPGLRASCFHSATRLSTMVTTAAPWITWISRIWREVGEQHAEDERADDHADQQHHVEEGDDARPLLRPARDRSRARDRRSASCAGRRRPAGRRAPRRSGRRPAGPCGVARQDQQRERHDGEAAELQQRADPDVGHAPPAEHRAVGVGAEADQRAERREHQRQRHHQRDQPARRRRARRSSRG